VNELLWPEASFVMKKQSISGKRNSAKRLFAMASIVKLASANSLLIRSRTMKRLSLLASIVLLVPLLIVGFHVSPRDAAVGSPIENFSLPDTDGKAHSLNDLRGKNGAVIVFLSAQCPVVRGYVDRINQLAADYQARGINFVGVNSNATESLEWVKSNIDEYKYKFPVLIDKGGVLADKLGANVTPEVFYVDGNNVLLYHGAIDNDRSGRSVTENYLRTAFDATLSGKKVTRTSANAFGCSIKRTAD
jgi:peroxiredoxin